jgi:poly(A) polymerase
VTVPVILARAEHALSRRDVDPDALKVLYRLHHAGFVAYLVGGSVRDLLLGRTPKDFDIGTSAHPHQIKRLFRNCWIIGRRFRLAHVKFGSKVIEVATFRRQVVAESDLAPRGRTDDEREGLDSGEGPPLGESPAQAIQRDNTFGTPEEDAFRRDFTVNALFYDISTFSVIDYVGGIDDLRARLIRSIGDPAVRFIEDPVRMLRAIVLAARLDFRIDPPVLEAIVHHGARIGQAAPARLLEELYKVLRSGAALRAVHLLGEVGLLQHVTPEIPWPLPHALERSLAALDDYRGRFDAIPDTFTNPVLLGSLIAPLGVLRRRRRRVDTADAGRAVPVPAPLLGSLPIARRDVELLEQALALQPRLLDPDNLTPRAQRALLHRVAFRDALTWLEIHGSAPDAVSRWAERLAEHRQPPGERAPSPPDEEETPFRRPPRRRRRRRRFKTVVP